MLGCAVAEQPVGGSMCLWEGGLGQLFSHMHENCSCKQWVPTLAVIPVFSRESLVKFVCIMASKVPFLVTFYHIVKVPCIFLFSFSRGKFCCSFCFNGYVGKKTSKTQQIVCMGRGKIISSAEPIKLSRETPVSVSWVI